VLSKEEALTAYRQGRLTLRELATALDFDTWGAHDLLASEGVAVAQGHRQETATDLEALVVDTGRGKPRGTNAEPCRADDGPHPRTSFVGPPTVSPFRGR
jgi:hypothetical protein